MPEGELTQIAELFVSLGLKGEGQVSKGLTDVKKGMGEVKSISLETKAAILAVVYGLKSMTSAAGALGTGLSNFAALTGLSIKQLQQFEYAAIQGGSSADELKSTVMGIQKAMAGIDLNKGVPEGLFLISQAAGGIDFSKKDDPFYMIKAIQKGVQAIGSGPKGKAIAAYLAESLQVSPDMIAAMQKNSFREDIFKKAPIISDRQADQLNKVDIAWKNLGLNVNRAFAGFTAKHGGQLVDDVARITQAIIGLADALTTLAEKTKVFSLIGKGVSALATVVKSTGKIAEDVSSVSAPFNDQQIEWMRGFMGNARSSAESIGDSISRAISPTSSPSPTNNTNIHLNQNFSHPGTDHHKVGSAAHDGVHKAISHAAKSYNQNRGT